jgi:hypothetical protein
LVGEYPTPVFLIARCAGNEKWNWSSRQKKIQEKESKAKKRDARQRDKQLNALYHPEAKATSAPPRPNPQTKYNSHPQKPVQVAAKTPPSHAS